MSVVKGDNVYDHDDISLRQTKQFVANMKGRLFTLPLYTMFCVLTLDTAGEGITTESNIFYIQCSKGDWMVQAAVHGAGCNDVSDARVWVPPMKKTKFF